MKTQKHRWSIRATFNATFLAVAVLPIILCLLVMFFQAQSWGGDLLRRETGNQIKINHLRLETMLASTEKTMNMLAADVDAQRFISSLRPNDNSDFLDRQREFSQLVDKYFDVTDALLGIELVTPAYTLSWSDRLGISKDNYQQSYIVEDLDTTLGQVVWYSTYNAVSMYKPNSTSQMGAKTQTVLTAGKRIIPESGAGTVRPVLLVHFRPSSFDDMFLTDNLFTDTIYIITDSYDNVVYENMPSFFFNNKYDLLKRALYPVDTFESFTEGGMVLNLMPVQASNWKIISVTPVSGAVAYFRRDFYLPGALLLLCGLGAAALGTVLMSRSYAAPLQALVGGISRTSKGDFSTPLPPATTRDFQTVFDEYDAMNHNIDRLLRENSDIKVHEKELELQVLNLQYNPHFLYNTLNSINLLAMASGQTEISELLGDLSYILRYSVNVKDGIVKFSEDLAYIKSYVALMRARYDNQFDFVCDVQPEVLEQRVPKFILQPLIENAILHGVQGLDYKGKIQLTGIVNEDEIVFVLEDNGRGMGAADDPNKKGATVGLSNTRARLKFYCGGNYAMDVGAGATGGTKITIRLSTQTF